MRSFPSFFLPFFILISLWSCTQGGGGLPTAEPVGTGPLDGSHAQGGDSGPFQEPVDGAHTPERPGTKVGLDPHDEIKHYYLFPQPWEGPGEMPLPDPIFDCTPPDAPDEQNNLCKPFYLSCADFENYEIEWHPEDPQQCRSLEIGVQLPVKTEHWETDWMDCHYMYQCPGPNDLPKYCEQISNPGQIEQINSWTCLVRLENGVKFNLPCIADQVCFPYLIRYPDMEIKIEDRELPPIEYEVLPLDEQT